MNSRDYTLSCCVRGECGEKRRRDVHFDELKESMRKGNKDNKGGGERWEGRRETREGERSTSIEEGAEGDKSDLFLSQEGSSRVRMTEEGRRLIFSIFFER